MRLSPYDKTCRFCGLTRDIQVQRVNIEYRHQWGSVSVGLVIVGYQVLTRFPTRLNGVAYSGDVGGGGEGEKG